MNHKISIKIILWLGLLGFILTGSLYAQTNSRETPLVKVVRDNALSVVNISTERVVLLRESPYWSRYDSGFDVAYDRFFTEYGQSIALKLKSVGSGAIVDQDGLVITNSHVVNKASSIYVVFNDGSFIEGQVMYQNPKDDLAIIKIETQKQLKSVILGKTDDLMVGESVVAMGNPLGIENSVSVGIVSQKSRSLYDESGNVMIEGLIQTDAPINLGNSGGALFNLNGEFIGLNVASMDRSLNIGFAVSVEKVKEALAFHRQNKNLPVNQVFARVTNPQIDTQQNIDQDKSDWDPYQEMARMRKEMDEMFQNFLKRSENTPRGSKMLDSKNFFDPNIEIVDKGRHYLINLDISDLDKEKVNVDVYENSITISGQYSREVNQDSNSGKIRSHSYGSMLKTLPLPKDADSSKMKTEIRGKQLIVTIPKKKN